MIQNFGRFFKSLRYDEVIKIQKKMNVAQGNIKDYRCLGSKQE